MSKEAGSPFIEARGIVKRFPAALANDHVDIDIRCGEVHALLGENGAGKSTLSKILYGFTRPDEGEIRVHGRRVDLPSPRDARRLGIGMVFQGFTLIPALSVLENIALFLPSLRPIVSERRIAKRIDSLSGRFLLQVDPSALVRDLAVGDRQKVEILKLLLADARLLILDEPTKVLAPHEVRALFRALATLKAEGYAILFITHKLREVLACADRITVMRQGRIAGSIDASRADEAGLVSLMFGGAAEAARTDADRVETARAGPATGPAAVSGRGGGSAGRSILELTAASARGFGSETGVRAVDLAIREGEIVGVAGVSGSGQKELGDLILGKRSLSKGSKTVRGENASSWSIAKLRGSGVAFIPEDPLAMAAVPGMTVRENLFLGTGGRYRRGLSIDWRRLEADMTASFDRLHFPAPRFSSLMRTLSGGTVQRAIVTRELAHAPRMIVALYPTRGLDVMSAIAVRRLLAETRDAGGGILLISEDLEELFELSDRLVVMLGGAIVSRFERGEFDADRVGRIMTGADLGKASA